MEGPRPCGPPERWFRLARHGSQGREPSKSNPRFLSSLSVVAMAKADLRPRRLVVPPTLWNPQLSSFSFLRPAPAPCYLAPQLCSFICPEGARFSRPSAIAFRNAISASRLRQLSACLPAPCSLLRQVAGANLAKRNPGRRKCRCRVQGSRSPEGKPLQASCPSPKPQPLGIATKNTKKHEKLIPVLCLFVLFVANIALA